MVRGMLCTSLAWRIMLPSARDSVELLHLAPSSCTVGMGRVHMPQHTCRYMHTAEHLSACLPAAARGRQAGGRVVALGPDPRPQAGGTLAWTGERPLKWQSNCALCGALGMQRVLQARAKHLPATGHLPAPASNSSPSPMLCSLPRQASPRLWPRCRPRRARSTTAMPSATSPRLVCSTLGSTGACGCWLLRLAARGKQKHWPALLALLC